MTEKTDTKTEVKSTLSANRFFSTDEFKNDLFPSVINYWERAQANYEEKDNFDFFQQLKKSTAWFQELDEDVREWIDLQTTYNKQNPQNDKPPEVKILRGSFKFPLLPVATSSVDTTVVTVAEIKYSLAVSEDFDAANHKALWDEMVNRWLTTPDQMMITVEPPNVSRSNVIESVLREYPNDAKRNNNDERLRVIRFCLGVARIRMQPIEDWIQSQTAKYRETTTRSQMDSQYRAEFDSLPYYFNMQRTYNPLQDVVYADMATETRTGIKDPFRLLGATVAQVSKEDQKTSSELQPHRKYVRSKRTVRPTPPTALDAKKETEEDPFDPSKQRVIASCPVTHAKPITQKVIKQNRANPLCLRTYRFN